MGMTGFFLGIFDLANTYDRFAPDIAIRRNMRHPRSGRLLTCRITLRKVRCREIADPDENFPICNALVSRWP